VATIHDLAPFHVRGKYDLARMFYGRVVVRALARRQTEIIAVSHNTAQDIERFFQVPVAQQTVVLNGLDHRQFQPTEPEPNGHSRHGLDQPFFLYVSRLEHPAKNHVRLIEAFNEYKASTSSPWQLVLGGSDWHGAEHIHAAAQASPFARRHPLPRLRGGQRTAEPSPRCGRDGVSVAVRRLRPSPVEGPWPAAAR